MHSSNLAELLVEFSAGVPQQERNRLLADRGELHLLLFSGPGTLNPRLCQGLGVWVWSLGLGPLLLRPVGHGSSAEPRRSDGNCAATTATAPVKKQLVFREGGLDFLILKRTLF